MSPDDRWRISHMDILWDTVELALPALLAELRIPSDED